MVVCPPIPARCGLRFEIPASQLELRNRLPEGREHYKGPANSLLANEAPRWPCSLLLRLHWESMHSMNRLQLPRWNRLPLGRAAHPVLLLQIRLESAKRLL